MCELKFIFSLPQGARAVIAGEGAGVGEVASAARARNLLDEEKAEHGSRAHYTFACPGCSHQPFHSQIPHGEWIIELITCNLCHLGRKWQGWLCRI